MNTIHDQHPQSNLSGEVEISFLEFWNILISRRRIFLKTFFLVLLLSVIYILTSNPVYEGRAVIQIGVHGDGEQIVTLENMNVLRQRLQTEYPDISSVTLSSFGARNIIIIALQLPSEAETNQRLELVIHKLLLDHELIYQPEKNRVEAQVEFLNQQIHNLEKLLSSISTLMTMTVSQLKDNRVEQNLIANAILTHEKGNILREISRLKDETTNLERTLDDTRFGMTRLIGQPVVQKIKPDLKKVAFIGILGGLVLGILFTYFSEVHHRIQNRDETKISPTP